MTKMKRYDQTMIDQSIEPEAFYKDITEQIPAEEELNGPETKNGIVDNTIYVKVRKEPSLEADVLELVGKGDKVKILGLKNGFYKVITSTSSLGYILSDFIKEG